MLMDDSVEFLMGERISDILNECHERKQRHYEKESAVLDILDDSTREIVDGLLEDFILWGYEDCRTVYCAGIEDGIRLIRKILAL